MLFTIFMSLIVPVYITIGMFWAYGHWDMERDYIDQYGEGNELNLQILNLLKFPFSLALWPLDAARCLFIAARR